MWTRLTTKEFITKAQKVHDDRYNYSKAKYRYGNEEIIIICKIHGEFLQIASSHLNGRGCKKCGIEKLKHRIVEFCHRGGGICVKIVPDKKHISVFEKPIYMKEDHELEYYEESYKDGVKDDILTNSIYWYRE